MDNEVIEKIAREATERIYARHRLNRSSSAAAQALAIDYAFYQIMNIIDACIRENLKSLGFVQLAENQDLPGCPPEYVDNQGASQEQCIMNTAYHTGYKQAQQDMLKAGWRKIKVEEK